MTIPTRKECIMAFCHDCGGHYTDGKVDCENTRCALYYYMPYRKKEPDYTWQKYNPTRRGLVTWEESERELSDEARANAAERLAGIRKRKNNTT